MTFVTITIGIKLVYDRYKYNENKEVGLKFIHYILLNKIAFKIVFFGAVLCS